MRSVLLTKLARQLATPLHELVAQLDLTSEEVNQLKRLRTNRALKG